MKICTGIFFICALLSQLIAQDLPDLPVPIGAGTCEVWHNTVYHFGGSNDDIASLLYQRIYRYDGSWAYHDSIPYNALWGVESVLAVNDVYLLGGFPGMSFYFKRYSLEEGTWFTPAHRPSTIWTWGVTAEYFDGYIYLFLPDGYNYRYEIAADEWTSIADSPANGDAGLRSVLFDNEIYVIGYYSSGFYKYSPEIDRWTQLADSPYPVNACGMGILDSTIYCIGGDWYKSIIAYDIPANEWHLDGFELSSERYWMATAKYLDNLYVVGGIGEGGQAVNTVEKIVPQGPVGIKNAKNPPQDFGLLQNYPNPFNPSTTIEFILPRSELVTLRIYNVLGEEVVTLTNKMLAAGRHKYVFEAGHLASGIYVCCLNAGNSVQKQKMMLLK
ncbi:MAG: T9SS type A sorting domain-containing protein [Calditrichia bacterium]